jgi:hypothetical protein
MSIPVAYYWTIFEWTQPTLIIEIFLLPRVPHLPTLLPGGNLSWLLQYRYKYREQLALVTRLPQCPSSVASAGGLSRIGLDIVLNIVTFDRSSRKSVVNFAHSAYPWRWTTPIVLCTFVVLSAFLAAINGTSSPSFNGR